MMCCSRKSRPAISLWIWDACCCRVLVVCVPGRWSNVRTALRMGGGVTLPGTAVRAPLDPVMGVPPVRTMSTRRAVSLIAPAEMCCRSRMVPSLRTNRLDMSVYMPSMLESREAMSSRSPSRAGCAPTVPTDPGSLVGAGTGARPERVLRGGGGDICANETFICCSVSFIWWRSRERLDTSLIWREGLPSDAPDSPPSLGRSDIFTGP
mmetsp:Transcript_26082/g.66355  ORF Transcript_26082/g.66355 Transcript_26082/m.66355 type:complete len:208 (-) Transcript_26082:189-812(-)